MTKNTKPKEQEAHAKYQRTYAWQASKFKKDLPAREILTGIVNTAFRENIKKYF